MPLSEISAPLLVASSGASRVNTDGVAPTFSSAVEDFVPVATPTDFAALTPQNEGRAIYLKRVSVSGVADVVGNLNVRLQTSVNGGLNGFTQITSTAKHDARDTAPTGQLWTFPANRTAGLGNGISTVRQLLRTGKLYLGPTAADCRELVFEFGLRGAKAPVLKDNISWFVLNLNGQTLPTNTKINVTMEWSEEKVTRVLFAGDSTYSNATELFSTIGDDNGGAINSYTDVRNYGSNGFRLTDYINNTNGVTYPQSAVLNANPDKLAIGYGLNDLRQGATSQAALTAQIVSAVTTTLAARPDCKILLHGPNSVLTDDPTTSGAVTATGLFSGMTLAQAGQAVTDMGYGAYADAYAQLIAATPSLASQITLIQRQDVTGRTAGPAASRPLMLDTLHPNARGRTLIARQVLNWARVA